MKKIKPLQLKLIIVAFGLLILSACGPKNETTVTIQTKASAMGPFFAGPNSLIAEYAVNLSAIEGLENVNKEQIKEIKIKAISVHLNKADSLNANFFSSASLQIVSSNTGMKTIAIKNPIDTDSQELSLEVSDEADIADYFKNEKFSLVLDLDFLEDSYNEEIGATLVLDLNIKHN